MGIFIIISSLILLLVFFLFSLHERRWNGIIREGYENLITHYNREILNCSLRCEDIKDSEERFRGELIIFEQQVEICKKYRANVEENFKKFKQKWSYRVFGF